MWSDRQKLAFVHRDDEKILIDQSCDRSTSDQAAETREQSVDQLLSTRIVGMCQEQIPQFRCSDITTRECGDET
ncbi:MAG: hypothetical protein H0X45_06180 [Planctomycetes bacterium]|nr:hypothetical protein [Planctomycetota bacterium]